MEHKHKRVESESEKLDAEDVSFISYSKPIVLHIPQAGICNATGLRIIIKLNLIWCPAQRVLIYSQYLQPDKLKSGKAI